MNTSGPKVLHLITRLDAGGSTTNTLTSIDLLRKYGFETSIGYGPTNDPRGSVKAKLAEIGAPEFRIPHLVRNVSPIDDFLALLDILRVMRAQNFDLIHTHTSKAGVLGRLAAAKCGIPVVHTPHGHIFYGYWGPQLTAFFVHIERWMAKYTARIVSLTNIETKESLERGIGTERQYATIHSGVPLEPFTRIPRELGREFRKGLGIPDNVFLFVSVGRLTPVKGFDVLLEALAKTNFGAAEVFLAVVGAGEDKELLTDLSRKLGVADCVRFAGELADVRPALSAANAFVLASRNEGMGRAFVEAMAAGLPVIGTEVGGVPALIRNGFTGLLAQAGNPTMLASVLERLVSNHVLCDSLGKQAAAVVYPEYDEKTMIEKLASLYREVITERASRR